MTIPTSDISAGAIPPAVLTIAPSERRTDQRVRSVLRVGKIVSGGRETLCLIRNISSGGLMAHVYRVFDPYEDVAIEIRNGHVQTGRVAWYSDGRMGIAFDEKIDVLHFLADEQSDRLHGLVPRAPRLKVAGPATLRANGEAIEVGLHDISQGGAKLVLADTQGPAVNDDVVLSIPGLPTVAGSLRWRETGHAGVGFNRLIGFDTLAQWIAAAA